MNTSKLCLTLLLAFIITAGNLHAQHENSIEGDYRALMDLYESTNGDDWYDRTGWTDMTPQTMGNAVGIEVNEEGRVVMVDMQKVTFTGSTTSGNNLTGALPESIGNLKKVTYLNVKQNKLAGQIPDGIGQMESLEWLSLGGQGCDIEFGRYNTYNHRGCPGGGSGKEFEDSNTFSGDLPASIGNLSNLEVIEIRKQSITGTLPPEWGNLSNLRGLFLDNRVARGDVTSGQLLSGGIPEEWAGMTLLEQLWLTNREGDGDGFTGTIPKAFKDALITENRAFIYISNNDFTGDLPDFPNLRHIRVFDVSSNNFTGVFPIQLFNQGNNSVLNLFDISRNNLSGAIPDDMVPPVYPTSESNYNHISVFRVRGAGLEGPLPEWIQTMKRHQQFTIPANNFTGPFPKTLIESNNNLRFLKIEWNQFSGELPANVQWPQNQFKEILIDGNDFEGPIPAEWSNLYSDFLDSNGDYDGGFWRFEARNNNLSGEIPAWLADITTLRRIRLTGNRFTFKDILPNYSAILSTVEARALARGVEPVFEIGSQKPFGNSIERTMPEGSTLVLDLSEYDYEGNQYQWYKDGEPVNSANSSILTINSVSVSDEGEYVLKVTNDGLPELGEHESEPIQFQIGVDDGGNDDDDSSNDGGDEREPTSSVFPAAPVQQGPDSSSSGISLNPEFRWSSVEGADYYELHASQTNPGGLIFEMMVEDTVFIPKEIIGQDRLTHWRVRAVKDNENGEWSPIWKFRTQNADLPEIADLVSPGNSEKNMTVTPDLKWTSTSSDTYKLRLWKKDDPEYLIEAETDQTEYKVEDSLAEDTEFIWQVKSVANGVEGAWGPLWKFSTGEYNYRVQAPSLIAPGQGVNHETLTPRFEWESVDADHYIISVTRDTLSSAKMLSSGEDENIVILEDVSETLYLVDAPLDAGTTYYWHVRGVKDGEEGEWSETWEFKTPEEHINVSTYPGESPLVTELKQNYPNPFNPVTQIEFTLTDVQDVSLTVFNIAGRQVATLVDGFLQAGRHTATFDAGRLASGVYIYRFISDNHRFTKKMTLVK